MKKKSILFALAAVCLPLALSAQKEREITLNEAIAMARIQSVDAAVALNELKNGLLGISHLSCRSSAGSQPDRNPAQL